MNRMKFGEEGEAEISQEKMGFGMGMLSVTSTAGNKHDLQTGGASGSGRGLKQVKAKEEKRMQAAIKRQRAAAAAGGGGGMSSSLAFTPVQGIELAAPQAPKPNVDPSERYFANSASFLNI